MKKVIFIFGCFFFISCSTTVKREQELINQKIEGLLAIHRQYAFMDLYNRALKKEKEQFKIPYDSLLDISSMELIYDVCLMVDFYSEDHPSYIDENYNRIRDKWLKKDYKPYMPLDDKNLRPHMTFRRAFDFYESEDLAQYIDSLRTLFREKQRNNTLRSLECYESTMKYWEQMKTER
ncbi:MULTISPECIES: hypothetical protein [unclassified Myroides]|uniref:hypothetical protein n=1 Tax=unclassified Myroides TaxID=2642485 RepID=UPI003D2F8B7B